MELYGVLLTMRCCWGNLVRKAESPLQTPLTYLFQNNSKQHPEPPQQLLWHQNMTRGTSRPFSINQGVVLHSWCLLRCCGHGRHLNHLFFSPMCWCQRKGSSGVDTPCKGNLIESFRLEKVSEIIECHINPALSPSGVTAF